MPSYFTLSLVHVGRALHVHVRKVHSVLGPFLIYYAPSHRRFTPPGPIHTASSHSHCLLLHTTFGAGNAKKHQYTPRQSGLWLVGPHGLQLAGGTAAHTVHQLEPPLLTPDWSSNTLLSIE